MTANACPCGQPAPDAAICSSCTRDLTLALLAAIAAQKTPCTEPYHDQFPKPSCWTCARNGAFHRSARIAADLLRAPGA